MCIRDRFNVGPGTPFFPAAYHEGPASFAFGCETAAILADALPRANGDMAAAQQLVRGNISGLRTDDTEPLVCHLRLSVFEPAP